MNILIPMAGRGERFIKEGYSTPKPLIPVNNVPMVIKAVKDLPPADNYEFIILKEHSDKYKIEAEIKKHIPNASFTILDHVTEGQACTCLLGLEHLSQNDEVLIGACDNGMIYNLAEFEALKNESDVLVFTFRNNVTVLEKPEQYGWVKVSDNGIKVESVSVKKQISQNPIQDHAIVGAFWFKEVNIFKIITDKMISENRRINNEFYVDECINDAIELGYRVNVFEISNYICWGTPNDYLTYLYWQNYFNKSSI
jgi:NDP-sugar pyrophosphorylase family protein